MLDLETRTECVWCGKPLGRNQVRERHPFCCECHVTYEKEAALPLHAGEERLPHHD